MLRVVADVNVLVSAVIAPQGVCGRLLDAAAEGRWQLVVSEHLVAEFEAVLGYHKMRRWIPVEDITGYVAGVLALAELAPDAPEPWPPVTRDPKDDYLVALARTAKVDVLVSGDVHLTELVDMSPPVMTPAAFSARL